MSEVNQIQRKPGRALWRLCLAAFDLYAVLVLAYLALRALGGNRLWPVALLSTFAHVLLLPSLALLPLMIWLRRRWAAALLSMAGAAAVWLFGPLFISQAAPPAGMPVLVVMTANVGMAYYSPVEKFIDVLESSGADIIALQELSEAQQAAIEHDLADLYPYRALYGKPTYHVDGKGLLSKYPIVEASAPFQLWPGGNTHMRAVIDVNGTPVTVIVAHPPPPRVGDGHDMRPEVIDEIKALTEMATAGGAALLLGDFNATDQNDRYALVRSAGLIDAFRVAGWGFGVTWPAEYRLLMPPLVRIDYIWYTSHFRAVDAWVGPETGADHLPVLAKLVWQ
ncbi:MAG: endonuclease/exonuclease/phosphatase family protein [Anaerolineae bacterium]|nr:endonuclease/exonuclease/phosphatase family protein [Anaerolineae bacterium]